MYKANVEGICYVPKLDVQSNLQRITSVNGKQATSHCETLRVVNTVMHYLPTHIKLYFPDLKSLIVQASQLKRIEQEDLKPFPDLIELYLYKNDLETLEGDLFKNNRKLQYISLLGNKLKSVGENLLIGLTHLKEVFFEKNPCIYQSAHNPSEIPELIESLRLSCPSMKEMNQKLKNVIANQWAENAQPKRLQTDNNKEIIEKFENLSTEITKLKHEIENIKSRPSPRTKESSNANKLIYIEIANLKHDIDKLKIRQQTTERNSSFIDKGFVKGCEHDLEKSKGWPWPKESESEVFPTGLEKMRSEINELIVWPETENSNENIRRKSLKNENLADLKKNHKEKFELTEKNRDATEKKFDRIVAKTHENLKASRKNRGTTDASFVTSTVTNKTEEDPSTKNQKY